MNKQNKKNVSTTKSKQIDERNQIKENNMSNATNYSEHIADAAAMITETIVGDLDAIAHIITAAKADPEELADLTMAAIAVASMIVKHDAAHERRDVLELLARIQSHRAQPASQG